MPTLESKIHTFFTQYALRFNDALKNKEPDIEGTAAAFAEAFIGANPQGVFAGKNDEEFRKAIPQGNAYYQAIGTQEMTIKSIDCTQLDEFHAMAKVHWHSTYRKKEGQEETIDFDVIYFLQIRQEALKIFAYITGDEQKALMEHGLLPPKP